jgi:hypothetical protein
MPNALNKLRDYVNAEIKRFQGLPEYSDGDYDFNRGAIYALEDVLDLINSLDREEL